MSECTPKTDIFDMQLMQSAEGLSAAIDIFQEGEAAVFGTTAKEFTDEKDTLVEFFEDIGEEIGLGRGSFV